MNLNTWTNAGIPATMINKVALSKRVEIFDSHVFDLYCLGVMCF